MIRLAVASEGNKCSFSHSSRKRPLKLSTKPFCCGLPRDLAHPQTQDIVREAAQIAMPTG
jgi:hypothetical protein